MMQHKSSTSQQDKKTQTKGEREKDGIVVKKPTLALKKKKKIDSYILERRRSW
jgi:hypothetical protein